jgi:peroxiredoxin
VFCISTDRSFSHRAFAETEELAFALLSDSDGSVAESYEEFNGHKRIAKRSVFVVDTDGTIRYAWSTDDPTV